MNKTLIFFGAFALGVGCGSVGAYFYLRNRFDAELDEQTEDLKQWAKREVERELERAMADPFLSEEDEVSSDMEQEELLTAEEFDTRSRKIRQKATAEEKINYASISRTYRGEKPSLEELAEKLRAGGVAPSEDGEDLDPKFTDCYQTIHGEDTGPIPLHSCEGDYTEDQDGIQVTEEKCLECPFFISLDTDANSDYGSKEDFISPAIETKKDEDAPDIEVISEDEFFDQLKTYDSEQLTYYKQDDVLADADDDVVSIDEYIGGDALEKFEDEVVYVRNHLKQTDYEVTEEDKSYHSYVLGIDDEDDRGMKRRFADEEEE